MMAPKMPRDRAIVLDLGRRAHDVTDVELAWTNPPDPEEAALTTRWHFAYGSAPQRIRAEVRLPDGEWDAEITLTTGEKAGAQKTTRSTTRVNLVGTSWWKRDSLSDTPVVLHVREALQ